MNHALTGGQRKWLCPWGTQMYDETHREPICELPQHAIEMSIAMDTTDSRHPVLTEDDVEAAIDDEAGSFERVFVKDLEGLWCLENLHRHPCEELHIVCCGQLDDTDIDNIVRCESLRVLRVEVTHIPHNLLRKLAQLPNLQIFRCDRAATGADQLAMLRLFPQTTILDLAVNGERETEEMRELLCARKDTLEHVYLSFEPSPSILLALLACEQLQGVTLAHLRVDSGRFSAFFINQRVQQGLRYLDLSVACVTEPVCALLASFTNLRWLDISDTDISGKELCAILESNAAHIRHVSAQGARFDEADDLLLAVEQCAQLEVIDMRYIANHDVREKILAYKKSKRRNHEAIWLLDEDVPGLSAAINDASSTAGIFSWLFRAK